MKKLLVIGSGTMGAGIAQVAAESGIVVLLNDTDLNRLQAAQASIGKLLDKKVQKGKLSEDDKKEALDRIYLLTELNVAAQDADFVIEAIFENLEAKLSLFKELEQNLKPDTIIASNTSTISITKMAKELKRPENFVGMHFFSPVPAMRLVEVIKGEKTSEATLKAALEMAEKLGKTPIAVSDVPGFIVNRFMCLMYNEAAQLIQDGVATAKDIDTAMKLGVNHPMGPLEISDMAGVDIVLNALESLYTASGDERYKPAQLLKDMVAQGKLGQKSGEGFYNHK
ncbi:MAG: 3-hydroxyacyl-CoA dehydrogenase family protein [Firmicutes bacterium]|nr:3-hydroxyacyl-CoA dehydrogenase family protein [Bacillota bacterium]